MSAVNKKKTGKLRLIGGVWRRHQLPIANVPGLRPSSDRLREVVFSWIGPNGCEGAAVLDLFSGTGALGLEAASRGGFEVMFVESHAKVAEQLKANIRYLLERWNHDWGQLPHLKLIPHSVESVLNNLNRSYDLIFLDPPFGSTLLKATLPKLKSLLKPNGLVYVEWNEAISESTEAVGHYFGGQAVEVLKYKRIGAVHAHLIRFA